MKDTDSILDQLENVKENINDLYKMSFVLWILMMQCGFAFLEAGSVRSKNTTNILFKNILDMSIGAIVFWAFGFAFIEGTPGNGFIGHNHFFGSFLVENTPNKSVTEVGLTAEVYYPELIYSFAFAVTAATIVSGALAERTQFACYVIYSILITGFIYPVVAHWTWSDYGWLHNGAGTGIRFKDFAGSATVHVVGGTASLIGVFLIKPREGRFLPRLHAYSEIHQLKGHNVPLTSLGGFILIIGFLAFNGGSISNITDKNTGVKMSMVFTNTLMAGSSGALTSTFIRAIINKLHEDRIQWSLLNAINGCLAGMVASCAAADVVYPWASVVIGFIAGVAYLSWDKLLIHLKLDDAVSAVPVHLGGGLAGSLTAPLFAFEGLSIKQPEVGGVFYSWSDIAFKSFGWNLFGTVCIMLWSGFLCGLLFFTLRRIGFLRVSIDQERNGLDIEYHELAYPETIEASVHSKRKREF